MRCLDYFYARIKRPRNAQLFSGDVIEEGKEEGERERERGRELERGAVAGSFEKDRWGLPVYVKSIWWGWKNTTTPLTHAKLSPFASVFRRVCVHIYRFMRRRMHTHEQSRGCRCRSPSTSDVSNDIPRLCDVMLFR